MGVDWSISIGNVLTIVVTLSSLIAASVGFVQALKSSIATTSEALKSSIAITSEKLNTISGRMINVENEIKEIAKTMAMIAVQDQRMSGHTQRMDTMEQNAQEFREWVRGRFDTLEGILRRHDGGRGGLG